MAVRWYAGFAVLVTLAFLLYAAERAALIRLPWRPALEAGLKSVLLRPTWTIDLESGEQGTPQADLLWGMAAKDQPYLGVRGGALIASVGDVRWQELNAIKLATLGYAANRYSAWGPDAPVHAGAVFAVRTVEGNFAKVRVAGIRDNDQLRLEWLLFAQQKAAPASGKGAPPGPALSWLPPRDEALAAYRAKRYQEALDTCGRAVAIAAQAGDALHALALVTCGGLTDMQPRAPRQMEEWLKQAVAIVLKLDQGAIVSALGPGEAMLKERCLRMLGVFYRDQNRPREAMDNFAFAVDTVRAMPSPETADHRMALRSDLFDLGLVLAQLGYRGTALKAFGEAREYYLKTEPNHSTLKVIEDQERRLGAPGK